MTWKSHRTITFATVFTVTGGNLLAAGLSAMSAHLPDKIEFSLLPTQSLRSKYHRTYTHWLLMYLIIASILYAYMNINNIPWLDFDATNVTIISLITNIMFWGIIGCIMHILEDAPCGKVPVFLPKSKLKICPRLFTVGHISEYIFDIVIIVICVYFFKKLFTL